MMVNLRPAEESDADYLYRVRTDPETVRQSANRDGITREAHGDWLRRVLADSNRRLYVAETPTWAGWEPIGTGRLDQADGIVTYSIAVAPEHRGRGYAVQVIEALLEEAQALWPDSLAVAFVRQDNAPSLRAFLRAGFRGSCSDLLRLECHPASTQG